MKNFISKLLNSTSQQNTTITAICIAVPVIIVGYYSMDSQIGIIAFPIAIVAGFIGLLISKLISKSK